jgi:holliday junction DNA helicase RuvA
MIGRLTGTLLEKQPPHLLIEVNGVGYEVEASMHTFYKLPEPGQCITLHTHFVVRDDAQLLYGFCELRERALFRQLIKVNGVGPKLAITILSSIEPDEFVRCINDNDSMRLVKLPGVGKKTAERLIVEMRDRLGSWENSESSQFISMGTMTGDFMLDKITTQEAISALVSLGYKPAEAQKAVSKIATPGMTSADMIRSSLKGMMK